MRLPGPTHRNIYVRSRRAGERVMESLTRFLTMKLKRKVNVLKRAVARPWERKFLGFSFTSGRVPKRRIAPKATLRFKERVRELTRRTRGVSTDRMAKELARYLQGWLGHFGKCETPSLLEGLERWFRRRLRSAIWKQWRRGTVRFAELRKRGVGTELAAKTAGSAQSQIDFVDHGGGLKRLVPPFAFHVAASHAAQFIVNLLGQLIERGRIASRPGFQ